MGNAGSVFVDVLPDLRNFGKNLEGQVSGLPSSFAGVNRAASQALTGIVTIAGQASVALTGLGVAGAKIGIDTNAGLETAELQFRTLLGSADAAKDRVAELFDFAKRTPFETEPVIQASRLLQTFGGDALAAKENLTLVGDAAAATSSPIEDLAFWVGRAYSAIQGGQPFGEAAMRLQELAILSPKARQEMEQLQESGASATDVWAVLQGELGKFTGSMELQAESWTGLKSTISDFVALTSADVFKPLFSSLKNVTSELLDLGNAPGVKVLLGDITDLVAKGSAAAEKFVTNVIGRIEGADLGGIIDRFQNLGSKIEGLEPLLAGAGAGFAAFSLKSVPFIGALVPAWAPVVAAIGGFILKTDEGRDALAKIGDAGSDAMRTLGPVVVQALRDMTPSLTQFVEALGDLAADAIPVLARVLSSAIPTAVDIFKVALDIATPLLKTFGDVLQAIPQPLLDIIGIAGGAAFAVSKITTVLAPFGIAAAANPWVLGIGATAFALAGLFGVFDTGPDRIKPNEQAVRDFTDALKEEHRVITEGSTAKLQDEFLNMENSREAVQFLKGLGVTWDDVVAQLGKGQNSFNQWIDGLERALAPGTETGNAENLVVIKNLRQLAADWNQAIATGSDWASFTQDLTLLTDIFSTSLQNLGGSIKADSEEFFSSGVLLGATAGKFHEAEANASNLGQAILASGGSAEDAKRPMQDLAAKMVEAAQAAGLGEEKSLQYTAALLGVPKDVATDVHNTADFARVLAEIYDSTVRGVPTSWSTNFDANTDTAMQKIHDLQDLLRLFGDNADAEAAGYIAVYAGYSKGGYVDGPSGAGDVVPARLSPGEFVLSKAMLSGQEPVPDGVRSALTPAVSTAAPFVSAAPPATTPSTPTGDVPLIGELHLHQPVDDEVRAAMSMVRSARSATHLAGVRR